MVKRGRQSYALQEAHSREAADDNILDELDKKKKQKAQPQEETKNQLFNIKHIVGVTMLIIIFFAVFTFLVSLQAEKQNMTIDDYHELNYLGEEGENHFLYNSYSFVKAQALWNTQLTDKTGKRIYEMKFRYSPREVQNVTVAGPGLHSSVINATKLYMSFDPEAEHMNYVALAAAEMTLPLAAVVKYEVTAACLKNATEGCVSQPIVTCESHNESLVIEIHEGGNTAVAFDGNCIIIDGKEEELMRAADRLIYEWLGIIRN